MTTIDKSRRFGWLNQAHIARQDRAVLMLERPHGHHNHPCLCQNVSYTIPCGGSGRYTPIRRTPYSAAN
jgi:hypothetical protein